MQYFPDNTRKSSIQATPITPINAQMFSLKGTRIADKPNEDYAICDTDRGIFIVLDGVSRDRYEYEAAPGTSTAADATHIIGDALYNVLTGNNGMIPRHRLEEAFLAANEEARRFNAEHAELDFAAGCVGIIGIIDDERLHYLHIGDCVLYSFDTERRRIRHTFPQTAEVVKHKGEFTADEIRHQICNNPEHPCAYGVIDGNPQALSLCEFGKIHLEKVSQIAMMSDGLEYAAEHDDSEHLFVDAAKDFIHWTASIEDPTKDDKILLKFCF